jgi:hypothetical protein
MLAPTPVAVHSPICTRPPAMEPGPKLEKFCITQSWSKDAFVLRMQKSQTEQFGPTCEPERSAAPCPMRAEAAITAVGCLITGKRSCGRAAIKSVHVFRRHQLSPIAITMFSIDRSSQSRRASLNRPSTGYRLRIDPAGSESSSCPSIANSPDISRASSKTDAWPDEPSISSLRRVDSKVPTWHSCRYSIEQGLST